MKTHQLTAENGMLCLYGDLLLVRYPEGDCDSIDASNPDMTNLKHALYDERECSDEIAYGDLFEWNGVVFSVDQ